MLKAWLGPSACFNPSSVCLSVHMIAVIAIFYVMTMQLPDVIDSYSTEHVHQRLYKSATSGRSLFLKPDDDRRQKRKITAMLSDETAESSFLQQEPALNIKSAANTAVALVRNREASSVPSSPTILDRRKMIGSLIISSAGMFTAATTASAYSSYASSTASDPLEKTSLGKGTWKPMPTTPQPFSVDGTAAALLPPSFVTYLTRFLIQFDDNGIHVWWKELEQNYSLLSISDRQERLNHQFSTMAKSIQQGVVRTIFFKHNDEDDYEQHKIISDENKEEGAEQVSKNFAALWDSMVQRFGSKPDALRQLTLLFALLPPSYQPISKLRESLASTTQSKVPKTGSAPVLNDAASWDSYFSDLSLLLPSSYCCQLVSTSDKNVAKIIPNIPVTTVDESNNYEDSGSIETWFGPLAATPLQRGLPTYTPFIYTLFGISGATGCALTHATVIPLDVVKTRAQTNPNIANNGNMALDNDSTAQPGQENAEAENGSDTVSIENGSGNMVTAAVDIVQNEGFDALLLGAQATIAGYFWYGLSVYPSYTFFKRFLTLKILPPEIAMVQFDAIALVAGALAAVVASLGLTPIEAARIRVVADPDQYRPLGLFGTLKTIAQETEDDTSVWRKCSNLYAGLPSLLTRQVIFGSVKFLAFERACAYIFSVWPFLRDMTSTSLIVSLAAGAFSGTLSSIVSQPADSLLTFVAQNKKSSNEDGAPSSMGLLEGCRIMIEQDGPGSLFRGLGSRCVWAGSIIAGQFLLYDVFRTFFHVSAIDLSQVYEMVIDLPTP